MISAAPSFALDKSIDSTNVSTKMTVLSGSCTASSHIAEGKIGQDLTKRQSRYFCDSVVIMNPNDDPKRAIISFAQKSSHTATPVSFAGVYTGQDEVKAQRVYLRPKEALTADDGSCTFYRRNGQITSLICGAKIDLGDRRTVPVMAIEVAEKAVETSRSGADKSRPYLTPSVAICSCPGTEVEFAIDDRGEATVIRAKTNYVGVKNAVKTKRWSASLAEKNGLKLLILDNGRNSRIMADLATQKSMGFLADGGVSDLICQVIVKSQ